MSNESTLEKARSFQEIKEQVLGSVGTKERDEYELEFRAEILKEHTRYIIIK